LKPHLELVLILLGSTLVHAQASDPIAAIVGPVIPMGQSPWPWYDSGEKANADELMAASLGNKPQLGAAAADVFTLADGCPITLTGPAAAEFKPGDAVVVGWNATDGDGSGHHLFWVGSRTGNTLISANECGLPPTILPASGLTVHHCGARCNQDDPKFSGGWWV